MSIAKRKFYRVIPLAAILFLSLWLLIRLTSPAAQQEQTKWTAQNHDKTNFPLVGKHQTVACGECHLKGIFEGTPTACEACHWERRQDDRYKLQLGLHCGDCHTPQSWKEVAPAKWNHTDVTGFRLEGVHGTLDCADCHRQNGLGKAAAECYACHQENFGSAKNPDHGAAGFPTQCQICHRSTASWQGAVFSHKFQLLGKHKLALCSDCHKSGQYAGLPTACLSCHLNDYNRAGDPNHKQAGFPTDCVVCHGNGATGWQNAKFDHNKFALKGKHKIAACADCHKNGQYTGTPSTCVSCHLNDYNGTTDPNHPQAGFPTDCVACHGDGAAGWTGAGFDHTKFVLKGKHKTAACADCHKNGQYAGTPSTCISCHLNDYNGTNDPNHRQANYSTDCATCHGDGAQGWGDANFVHSKFALKGKHKTAACADCHKNGQYAGTPPTCISCHLNDYNGTNDPNHKQANYSTDCATCHGDGAQSWSGASANHDQFWPLQGAHKTLTCNTCHSKGYNLPKDCYGCHAANYNSTTNPNHKSSGYSTTCENCHYATHTSWTQAVFSHSFPIKSGRHAGFSCTDCHLTSNYNQFSCIDCHTHSKSTVDSHHSDVGGYSYNSQACYSCHPRGSGD